MLTAVDTVSVEGIFHENRPDELGLLRWLALEDGLGRRKRRCGQELEVWVWRQVLMRLLIWMGFPGGPEVLSELTISSFDRRRRVWYRHLGLCQLG